MRLAVSSIAWPAGADAVAAALLRAGGATGVEIAPTKVWSAPAEVAERDACVHRAFWERQHLPLVAMQALLFGRPDLTLFDDPGTRQRTEEYLAALLRLGGWLGCRSLVFGSPRNRLAAGRSTTGALDTFRRLGDAALAAGVVLGIEPNPPEYGCDWVTTVAEGVQFVTTVAHPGVGLHLDSGGMTLTHESPTDCSLLPCHYHISEPRLAPIGSGGTDHSRFARELTAIGHDGWCSVEMRQPETDWESALADSLDRARELYLASQVPGQRGVA